MVRLSSSELRSLLDFLRKLYIPSGLAQIRDRLVTHIREVIPCEIATCDEMNPQQHTSIDRACPAEAFPPAVSRLWQRVMHEHPVLMHCQRTNDLHAYPISYFYSASRFHRLALYEEYYKQISVEDALCKGIRVSGPVVVGCGLHRSRRSFRQKDRLLFDLVGPHLTQAWQNAQILSNIQKEMRLLCRSLDEIRCGIIILTPRGRARLMTAQARRLLAECFGQAENAGHELPAPLRAWVECQAALVDSVHALQPRTPLVVAREGKRIEFRYLSEPGRGWVLAREHRDRPDSTLFLRLGLTQREAEVLAWAAEGKTNAEIAVILKASPRTVQKHMEHIMAKLGVETRTSAARVALQTLGAS